MRRSCSIMVVTAILVLLSSSCSNLIGDNDADNAIAQQSPTITQLENYQLQPDATTTLEATKSRSETPPIWTDGFIFPEDAEVEIHNRRDGVIYTELSVEMATEFMLPQLEKNGWLLQEDPSIQEDDYYGRFIKNDEMLIMSIFPDIIGNKGTEIRISIERRFGMWTHKDIPLPEDAVVMTSSYGYVQIRTSLDIEDATEYMLKNLEIKGWNIEEEGTNFDDTYFASFILGKKHLKITIEQHFEPDFRTIRIETSGGEWIREDVPLPDDVEIECTSESMVKAITSLSFVDAKNFMLEQLETNGWLVDKVSIDHSEGYWGDFIKGVEVLTMNIFLDPNIIDATSIIVDIK